MYLKSKKKTAVGKTSEKMAVEMTRLKRVAKKKSEKETVE
jgi:hypothetical protein